jgi:hypothetical protein
MSLLTPAIGIHLLKDTSIVMYFICIGQVYINSSMKNQSFGSLHVVNLLQPICTRHICLSIYRARSNEYCAVTAFPKALILGAKYPHRLVS